VCENKLHKQVVDEHGLGGLLQHVITMPTRDRHEGNSFGVVANLFDEGGGFLDDFVESVLTPLLKIISWKSGSASSKVNTDLGSVHLVDGDDKLSDTEGERKESVLSSLAIFWDTSFEFTSTAGDDQDGAVSLGSTSNHVLDEIAVSGGINNLKGWSVIIRGDFYSSVRTVTMNFGVSNFQRAISIVIPRSRSAFSLSSTQA
jgi:hypothetical protein